MTSAAFRLPLFGALAMSLLLACKASPSGGGSSGGSASEGDASVVTPAEAASIVVKGVHVGDVGVVATGSSAKPWMTKTKDDMDEIMKVVRRDNAAAAKLINERAVPLVVGQRVRLLSPPHAKLGMPTQIIEVKIVDGPHTGATGFMWDNYLAAK